MFGGGSLDDVFNNGHGSSLGGMFGMGGMSGGLLGFMTHPFRTIMIGIGGILLLIVIYKILMA